MSWWCSTQWCPGRVRCSTRWRPPFRKICDCGAVGVLLGKKLVGLWWGCGGVVVWCRSVIRLLLRSLLEPVSLAAMLVLHIACCYFRSAIPQENITWWCPGGVPVVSALQWCPGRVPAVFQWCPGGGVWQWCSGGVPVVFRWCSSGVEVRVPVVSRWSCSGVPVVLSGGVPVVFRWCFSGVRWCPSGVPVVLQWCPGRIPILSRLFPRCWCRDCGEVGARSVRSLVGLWWSVGSWGVGRLVVGVV